MKITTKKAIERGIDVTVPSLFREPMKEVIEDKMKELKNIPNLYQFIMEHGFLAGGAVRDLMRSKSPSDWDIFFKSEDAVEEFKKQFGTSLELTNFGNYNYEDFQFITITCGSPDKVVGEFDWNVNQCYYDFGTKFMLKTYGEYLVLNPNATTPLSAILRIPHLLEKGFKIEPHEHLFALSFVSTVVNLTSPKSISNQRNLVSNGGYEMTRMEQTVERAVKAALKRSPLAEALK